MLKNNIAPWQEKGRWYHCVVESDGTSWTLNSNESDPIFEPVSGGRYLPLKNGLESRLIDVKPIMRTPYTVGSSIQLYTSGVFSIQYTSSTVYIVLTASNTITGTVDIYCYII